MERSELRAGAECEKARLPLGPAEFAVRESISGYVGIRRRANGTTAIILMVLMVWWDVIWRLWCVQEARRESICPLPKT